MMKYRPLTLLVLAFTALVLNGCGTAEVPAKTEARILMLEDQRNADMSMFAELLEDENPLVRARACLALGRIGDQERPDPYWELLAELLLKDKDSRVREMAAFALGEIEDQEGAEPLMAAIADKEPRVRAAAAEALSKLAVERAVIAISDLILDDPVEYVRNRALFTSFRFNSEKIALAAMAVLKEGHASLRWPAAYHFTRSKQAASMAWEPQLIIQLSEDDDPEIRKAAAKFLAYIRDAGTIDRVLKSLLLDEDMYVQINALRISGRMAYPGVIPVLLDFHKSAAVQVRQEMASTCGNLLKSMAASGMEESQEYQDVMLVVVSLVGDEDQAVASAAIDAAAALGEQSLEIVDLEALMSSQQPWVRSAAVNLFKYLPEEDAREHIRRSLNDPSSYVRIAATGAVREIGGQFATQEMHKLLKGDDQVMVSIAASWFRNLGNGQYVGELVEAYRRFEDNPDAEAIQSILGALAAFSGESEKALETLRSALESDNYSTRKLAANLLAGIDGESVFEKVGTVNNGRTIEFYENALAELQKYDGMLVKTEKGNIEMTFFRQAAPLTCYNFIKLAGEDFFADTIIHRVIPDFVAQMGDPRGDGWGGPGYAIRCEINQKLYLEGSVGMAHAGKDTGGSQLFIAYSPQPHLDGRHTVFAKVTEGMDVARKLSNGDVLHGIELIKAQ